jgi:outer membrane protein assembly factor BamA
MKRESFQIIFTLFILFSSTCLTSKEYAFISDIHIIGNQKTRDYIILRELPFKRGDIVDISRLEDMMEQGRNNVRNLSLFNFVYITQLTEIDEFSSKYKNVEIVISVDERWYHWPVMGITLEERNLSSWLKDPQWNKVTAETGYKLMNLAGRNQTVNALFIFGHNKGFRFKYSNITLDKKGRHFFDFAILRRYSRRENILSILDKPEYLYSDSSFLTSNYRASVTYTYRPRLRVRNKISLDYEYTSLDKAVLANNRKFWGDDKTERSAFTFTYGITFDQRDDIQYPLNGYYMSYQVKGYTSSDMSILYAQLKGDMQYYQGIFNRANISARFQWGLSAKNVEGYIFDRAFGYDDVSMRGYEFYVADGQHYAVISPTFRYVILPTSVYYLKFLRFLPKFNRVHMTIYGKSFFDAGYVYHKYPNSSNTLSNKLLMSCGLGLDIVTYYDITFSLDYSFNQLRRPGLFISLKAPIQ